MTAEETEGEELTKMLSGLPDTETGRYARRLVTAYRRYYNITPAEDLPGGADRRKIAEGEIQDPAAGDPGRMPDSLMCRCDFDVRNAQYILTKKNELWSAESHEYCYIFLLPHLTEELYRELESYVYEEGMKLIHPGKGHMCSTLTLLAVCSRCDPEALRLLKKCRIHKNFRFTLDGWMDFHTGLAVLGDDAWEADAGDRETGRLFGNRKSGRLTATNSSGHDNAKLLRQLMP